MTEHVYAIEAEARHARRTLIRSGVGVSLLSFDGSRERYVFDSYGRGGNCQCEHEDHFDGAGHPYRETIGTTPALYVAWICDECAAGHLSEYVRAE